MDLVGERMEKEEMCIPEVLMAAKAMSAAVGILKPQLAEGDVGVKGKVVIGTVKGDLHDIGKNLVAMMLENTGLEVHNLGVDISPEKFVEAIKATGANILALSALLTTTMPMMKETIDAITEAGIRDRVKIIVGRAPLTPVFARRDRRRRVRPGCGIGVKTGQIPNLAHAAAKQYPKYARGVDRNGITWALNPRSQCNKGLPLHNSRTNGGRRRVKRR